MMTKCMRSGPSTENRSELKLDLSQGKMECKNGLKNVPNFYNEYGILAKYFERS